MMWAGRGKLGWNTGNSSSLCPQGFFGGTRGGKGEERDTDHLSACQEGGEGLDLWQEAADQLRNPSWLFANIFTQARC